MRMNVAQNSGTTVMAKKYEAKMENTTPNASGVKMYLLMPDKKSPGKKTIEVVEVAASTASDTSMPPFSAASRGGSHLHKAEDVFEHHHGVVDQAREGQRQASQQHGVDGATHDIGQQQADQRGERNG